MGKNSQLRLTQYDLNAFNKNIKCPFNRIDKTFISNNRWGTMEKYTGKCYAVFVLISLMCATIYAKCIRKIYILFYIFVILLKKKTEYIIKGY